MNLKQILGVGAASALVGIGSLGMYDSHKIIERIAAQYRASSPIIEEYYQYNGKMSRKYTFKDKQSVLDEQVKFKSKHINHFEVLDGDEDRKKQERYLTGYACLIITGLVMGASFILPSENNPSR